MVEVDTYPHLVGDVGGTHVRFGVVREAAASVSAVTSYRCEDFASLWDALQRYLAEHRAAPRACALGIATAVTGDRVQLTNRDWRFSIADLQRRLGVERLLVLNDFTMLAMALPSLPAAALRKIGGGTPVPGAPLGLIGPGTGLGVSGLLAMPSGRGHIPVEGEGGHVTLAVSDDREAQVLQRLREMHGHVSAERVLSGPGLENLYRAVCELRGSHRAAMPAHEITAAALGSKDAAALETLNLFCSFLGNVAGNVALTLGARGGVYIGGGIVPRFGVWFDASPFRERFEAKGRFRDYLGRIPTYVVEANVPAALIGAARALELELAG